ncbi:Inhibitory regulator protein BUD2/CLA2 [Golovinomyces cichoracearum]|uniref:Inhibitory regulator protein BUD2/CLA2 n=1 Tax=Golovinomyces cichoracearum TaxID=62708 RepID=A0A420I273_9PEZI|nr:Inhibitory regulator protein BUD2/CLA2 [Golovinomyces cichoracearum]
MSVISQARLAEHIKEGQRGSWLIGNQSPRRYRQDPMDSFSNEDRDPGHKSGQPKTLTIDTRVGSLPPTDDSKRILDNRRHTLLLPRSSPESCDQTRTRTWLARDSSFSHRQTLFGSYSRNRGRSGLKSMDPRSPDFENVSSGASNFTTSFPFISNSLPSQGYSMKSPKSNSSSSNNSAESLLGDSKSCLIDIPDTEIISRLMKTESGRMRGEAECQTNGIRIRGLFYIDEAVGSLMYEGNDKEPNLSTMVADLRGLQIKPTKSPGDELKSIKLSNRASGLKFQFLPVEEAEFNFWLAAFFYWQRIRTGSKPKTLSMSLLSSCKKGADPQNSKKSDVKPKQAKVGNIIKVAKLLLWDGNTSSTTSPTNKSSLKDSSRSSWKQVSCTLQDNGQFKLMNENDNTPISVIQLVQLSRCSIQLIDRSVLDEEYCIAIFPLYASTSTQLSFFNPVYIASESRLMHEVWFCLLRAFTVPEIYGPFPSRSNDENEKLNVSSPRYNADNLFRIEKSIKIRIIEAKFSNKLSTKPKANQGAKPTKDTTDSIIGNYFVEVMLDGEIRARTSTRNNTKSPFWGEECEFQNLPPRPPSVMVVLKKVIPVAALNQTSQPNHKENNMTETLCLTTEILLSNLERGKESECWWPILDQQKEKAGEILLCLKYDEMVVLPASSYQPVSELLHNFSSGLTLQISQFIPAKLKIVSELMMNIFQVSGFAGEWLTVLAEDEIDGIEKDDPSDCQMKWSKKFDPDDIPLSALCGREQNLRDMGKSLQEEANLLFRGNSLLTQSLDFHMRRVGKEYLEDVLLEKISKINLINPDCEVDPSRISNSQDVNKNWTQLYSLTKDIWASIASSAERCPPELRRILKYIRTVAEDRYGNFLRTVAYTSVSGFLFLRFFCPALLNPKLFGLLRDNPQPKAQRTFTLIAKSLQALANHSNFGKKEAWMEPMNRFLTTHRKSMKQFIDSVCAISADQETSNLPASYSTPIIIFGRLSPTSREGFPSLPYLIDHAQNFSKLIKLWLESTTNNENIKSLQGELLQFHQLSLNLQHRAELCLRKAEQFNQNEHKKSQDILDYPRNTIHYSVPNYELNRVNLFRADSSGSASSRINERSLPVASEINIGYNETGLKIHNKGQPILKDLQTLQLPDRAQSSKDTSPISASRDYREEWPLRDSLGEHRQKVNENKRGYSILKITNKTLYQSHDPFG